MPSNQLHFIGGTVGGGFGGKVDTMTEPLAILAARLTGAPVNRAARTDSGSVRVSTLPPKPPPTVPPMKCSWFDGIELILAEVSSEKNKACVDV